MSIEKQTMEQAIQRALEMPVNYNPNDMATIRTRLARDIANAVDAYVVFKFNALKTALINPTAFTGTGATGPVTVIPGSITGYQP